MFGSLLKLGDTTNWDREGIDNRMIVGDSRKVTVYNCILGIQEMKVQVPLVVEKYQ